MPAPAVYVIAIIGGVAAAVAFKEFVYDPHIHPRFQTWRAEYAARQRRPVPVPKSSARGDGDDTELRSMGRGDGEGEDDDEQHGEGEMDGRVDAWRTGVDMSHPSGLRHRTNIGSVLDDSTTFLPYNPLSPTQVLFDISNETSPTSAHPSTGPNPNPFTDSAAVRVAGPPSSLLDSPLSTSLRPSDSASQPPHSPPPLRLDPGRTTPRPEENGAALSLSFAYDAQALHLSPPVLVRHPQLPSPPPSAASPPLVVRPSHPSADRTLGLGLGLDLPGEDERPDTPFSALSLGSGTGSYDMASPRVQTGNLRRLSVPRTSSTLSASSAGSDGSRTLLSPAEELFHSAISHAGTGFLRARRSGEDEAEFDFGDDTDEDAEGSEGSEGSWGSISGAH